MGSYRGYIWGYGGVIFGDMGLDRGYMGVYRDNGKENGSYYLGFRV